MFPERFNVLACGRRYGKTTMGVERLRDPIREGRPVGWFTPTYKMLLEVWRDVAKRLAPIATKVNATERRIEVLGGGVVEFWSLSEPDVARGRRYRRAVIDDYYRRALEQGIVRGLHSTMERLFNKDVILYFEEQGVPKDELAEKLGVSRATLYRMYARSGLNI